MKTNINTFMKTLLAILIFWTLSSTTYAQDSWKISEDYSIKFSGSGAEGTFGGLKGKILFDPQKPEDSKFEVTLDPSSIDTGNKTKNKHARGKSWFHVDKYIDIRFVSNKIYSVEQQYVAEGLLTLHGIEKAAKITFSYQESAAGKATFEGKLTVNRQDFGIEGPFISFMVGDEFEVMITVNAVKE
ncbi:MAG: YceI family protein [Bacteroidota bacterium]